MSKLREKGISVNEPRDVGKDLIINEEALKGPLLDVKSLLPSSGQALGASFNTVTFPEVSSELDGKYALRGRYGFDPGDRPETSELEKQLSSPDRLLPQTGTLRLEWSTNEVDMDTGNEGLHHKCVGSCIDLQVIDSTDETPSTSSSVFSKNDENEEPNTVVLRQISCKRKRRPSETPDLLATPLSSTALTEVSEEPEDRGIVSNPALFSPNTGKYAAGFLGSGMDVGDSNVTTMTGNNRVFIQVAQMVADQAVSSTKISQGPLERLSEPTLAERTPLRQFVEEILTDWSSRAGKVSKRCTLKDLVGLDDQDFSNVGRDHVNNISQRMQKPSYPTRASSAAGQMVSKLPSPYACVQRSGTLIDIAAPALRFWEELSLAPSHNGKDVTAFCIYPTERGVQDEISTFLTMVKGAYQSCKLGLHHLGSGPAKQANGLIPTPMDFLRPQESPPDLYRACEDLGSWLGKTKFQGRNTVIYMVNPSSHDASLPWLCTAFLKLFNAYSTMAKDQNIATPNDLVLQIIPSDLIYSETQISLPSPATYRRLAFEVYDRCGPNESGEQRRRPEYACAPSMRLAKAIPKTVDFRLTPENAPLSLQSDNCLHVAYTWKKGEDWLTASWTDNLGVLSWTACYCFAGKDDAPWHAFSEIAKEIWETSLDMLRPRNGPWRLVLCKDGGVYKHEMDGKCSPAL